MTYALRPVSILISLQKAYTVEVLLIGILSMNVDLMVSKKKAERKLCCVLNAELSCEACRIMVCRECCGIWKYHEPIESSYNRKLRLFEKYLCPTTKLEVTQGDPRTRIGPLRLFKIL